MLSRHRTIRNFIFILASLLVIAAVAVFISGYTLSKTIEEGGIESAVSFVYGGSYEVPCYVPDEDEPFDSAYVFLPSFANTSSIKVKTSASKVTFTYEDEVISTGIFGRINSFQMDVPYEMTVYDVYGTAKGSLTVTFMQSSSLPTVYVDTVSGSMDDVDADKSYSEEGTMTLVDVDGTVLYYGDLDGISARGNQTFTYHKKSYHLSLDDATDFFDMGTSDSWILLSNVFDISHIRNKLTYDMAVQADMYASPESVYVDVYLNGSYNGQYLLCEKIEIGENRIEIADLEELNEELNLSAELPSLDLAEWLEYDDGTKRGIFVSFEPEDVSGGYLIEHDYGTKFYYEISGFITDSGEAYVIKEPEHATEAEVEYISNLMQEIEDAVMSPDGINPDTGKHFTEYIDLESWADKFIVEEITRNNAGGITSSYFYKPEDSISTKVYGGPVWDYDKALARISNFNSDTDNLGFMGYHLGQNTTLFYYLYQHEEFVEMVKKEYEEKFSDYLLTMAEEKIDEYISLTADSSELDRIRCYDDYMSNGDSVGLEWEYDVGVIRSFILDRKEFLDKVWIDDEPICTVTFVDEDGDLLYFLAVIEGECLESLPPGRDYTSQYVEALWVIEDAGEFLTTDTPIYEDMTVVLAE